MKTEMPDCRPGYVDNLDSFNLHEWQIVLFPEDSRVQVRVDDPCLSSARRLAEPRADTADLLESICAGRGPGMALD